MKSLQVQGHIELEEIFFSSHLWQGLRDFEDETLLRRRTAQLLPLQFHRSASPSVLESLLHVLLQDSSILKHESEKTTLLGPEEEIQLPHCRRQKLFSKKEEESHLSLERIEASPPKNFELLSVGAVDMKRSLPSVSPHEDQRCLLGKVCAGIIEEPEADRKGLQRDRYEDLSKKGRILANQGQEVVEEEKQIGLQGLGMMEDAAFSIITGYL